MAIPPALTDRDKDSFVENPADGGIDRRVFVKNDANNPIPVSLQSGNVQIGTVNAELEVQLDHRDNLPDAGDVHDSVRIGDGVEELAINADNEALVHDQDIHNKIDDVTETITLPGPSSVKVLRSSVYGHFHSTPQSLSDGQASQIEVDENGHLITTRLIQHLSQQGFVFASGINFTTISGTSEAPLLYLKNPVSTKDLKLFRMTMANNSTTARSVFRLYINPTVTANGTPLTINNNKFGGSASLMESYYSPTVTSNGTFLTSRIQPAATPTLVFDIEHFLTVPENNSLLLTIENTINNTPVTAVSVWAES